MDVEITKNFFKKHYKVMLLLPGVFLALYLFDGRKDYALIFLFVFIYAQKYRAFVIEAKWTKATGQTAEQLANASFLNNWQETRARGFRKYCLVEGGLVNGAIIGILIGSFSVITGITNRFSVLNDTFTLIGVMYGIGIMIGIGLYRFYWMASERRFTLLTQPGHIIS
jgi:hypothetical protein